jgi:nuclear transcription Y subunit beta
MVRLFYCPPSQSDLRAVKLPSARRRIAASGVAGCPHVRSRAQDPQRRRITSAVSLDNGRPAAGAMSSASPHSSASPPQTTPKPGPSSTQSDANIRNFAPVARIMKMALPENAKIAKEAKECMQECVSEFISFITSEGMFQLVSCASTTDHCAIASEKCQQEKRKTVNGEDILFAMTSLGFENYSEALKIYLSRYREVSCRTSSHPRLSFVASTLAKTVF